jgi:hypothetical protein
VKINKTKGKREKQERERERETCWMISVQSLRDRDDSTERMWTFPMCVLTPKQCFPFFSPRRRTFKEEKLRKTKDAHKAFGSWKESKLKRKREGDLWVREWNSFHFLLMGKIRFEYEDIKEIQHREHLSPLVSSLLEQMKSEKI